MNTSKVDAYFRTSGRRSLQRQDTLDDIMDVIQQDADGRLRSSMMDVEKRFDLGPILEYLRQESDEPGIADNNPDNNFFNDDHSFYASGNSRPPSTIVHHYPNKAATPSPSPAPYQKRRRGRPPSTVSIKTESTYTDQEGSIDQELFYQSKRKRNNEAVRRSRQKSKAALSQMETRTKALATENAKLKVVMKAVELELAMYRKRNEDMDKKIKQYFKSSK